MKSVVTDQEQESVASKLSSCEVHNSEKKQKNSQQPQKSENIVSPSSSATKTWSIFKMSSSVSYNESHRPGAHFAEKIENFYRTTENLFNGKTSPSMFQHIRAHSPARMVPSLSTPREYFELVVEVPQYKPDEISVSTQEEILIISGKREENHPEFGWMSKEFTNKYTLPKNIEKEKMTCVFKDRGFLKVEAPFIKREEPNSKTIPIRVLAADCNGPATTPSPTPRVQAPSGSPSTSKSPSSSSLNGQAQTQQETQSTVSVSHV